MIEEMEPSLDANNNNGDNSMDNVNERLELDEENLEQLQRSHQSHKLLTNFIPFILLLLFLTFISILFLFNDYGDPVKGCNVTGRRVNSYIKYRVYEGVHRYRYSIDVDCFTGNNSNHRPIRGNLLIEDCHTDDLFQEHLMNVYYDCSGYYLINGNEKSFLTCSFHYNSGIANTIKTSLLSVLGVLFIGFLYIPMRNIIKKRKETSYGRKYNNIFFTCCSK